VEAVLQARAHEDDTAARAAGEGREIRALEAQAKALHDLKLELMSNVVYEQVDQAAALLS
jgi:hypothetical protein